MLNFKDTVFEESYSIYDKLSDPNKDINGKGTQERFVEVWASEVDDAMPYIENIGENLLVPKTRLDSMVGYAENDLGYLKEWVWFYDEPILFRKYLVGIMPRLYEIRGTLKCYEIMFAWLGITVVMSVDFVYIGGFDSPVALDSSIRTLDSFANSLISYTLDLNGPAITIPTYPATPSPQFLRLIRAIYTILLFNAPVMGTLKRLLYNGTDIHEHLGYIDPMLLRTNF